jgi:renalase
MKRVAVIGAGLSGLTCARMLEQKAEVRVFEKSRGYGGRMATRRHGDYRFDHGAQFFSARSQPFRDFLRPLLEQGLIARWDARFVEFEGNRITARRQWADEPPHYVAVPGMNALGRALGETLDVRLDTRVGEIFADGDEWLLRDTGGHDLGRFDWVVSSIPAVQAIDLLPDSFAHRAAVASREMPGCYALMLGFGEAPELDWDAALIRDAAISWISVDHSKPGRGPGASLLVQASNRWAEANMELADAEVIDRLVAETSRVTGLDVGRADHIALHRWRYANPGRQKGEHSLIDAERRLAAIGDWCIHGRVEAAFLSGLDGAQRIRALL